MLETGSVCVKTRGRKAGEKVVVLGFEKGFVLIEGKSMKKKRCNPRHLYPLNVLVDVKSKDVLKELEKV